MVRDVKYIWNNMSYRDLKNLLKENRSLRVFPLVESSGEYPGQAFTSVTIREVKSSCWRHFIQILNSHNPSCALLWSADIINEQKVWLHHWSKVIINSNRFMIVNCNWSIKLSLAENMILLGSIQRIELIKLIEKHIGRDRRLQMVAEWQKAARER